MLNVPVTAKLVWAESRKNRVKNARPLFRFEPLGSFDGCAVEITEIWRRETYSAFSFKMRAIIEALRHVLHLPDARLLFGRI